MKVASIADADYIKHCIFLSVLPQTFKSRTNEECMSLFYRNLKTFKNNIANIYIQYYKEYILFNKLSR